LDPNSASSRSSAGQKGSGDSQFGASSSRTCSLFAGRDRDDLDGIAPCRGDPRDALTQADPAAPGFAATNRQVYFVESLDAQRVLDVVEI